MFPRIGSSKAQLFWGQQSGVHVKWCWLKVMDRDQCNPGSWCQIVEIKKGATNATPWISWQIDKWSDSMLEIRHSLLEDEVTTTGVSCWLFLLTSRLKCRELRDRVQHVRGAKELSPVSMVVDHTFRIAPQSPIDRGPQISGEIQSYGLFQNSVDDLLPSDLFGFIWW